MTDTPSRRRSRMNRAEHAQRLYTARSDENVSDQLYRPNEADEVWTAFRPNEPQAEYAEYASNDPQDEYAGYTPNELQNEYSGYAPNEPQDEYAEYTPYMPQDEYAEYTPNDPQDEYEGYAPNDPQDEYAAYTPNEAAKVDYAAYYSREGLTKQDEAEVSFAPPPRMQQYAFDPGEPQQEEPAETYGYAAGNVYRPRQVTWAEEDREEAIAESELGYQVQEEAAPARRRKSRLPLVLLIVLLVLALLAGAAWLLRDELAEVLGVSFLVTAPTETPVTAVVTPEPIKAYDAAPAAAVADTARSNIARLSGTLPMDHYIVTDQHIVTRSQRADGSYDFYLFTSDGRLLCYFEGLDALDMIPQEFGGFYVSQAPWLVTSGGSALIRTADVEAAINESVFLHPMYHGWAVVESEADGHANYVNADGRLMSSLWFSRTFAFTGDYTLGYVDTGSDVDDRYLLYVLGKDGSMNRWLSSADMEDAVAAVCGMAYMSDGALYHLPETTAPIARSPEVTAYPDCDAMVVRDPETGKYGLFVHGEQHYEYAYDAIHPLKSDLSWAEKNMGRAGAMLTIRVVADAGYPQPVSYSFVLERDGQSEYVALSAVSSYPIRLDGEF